MHGLLLADYGYGAAPPALLARVPRRLLPRSSPWTRASVSLAFRGVTACTPNQEEVGAGAGLNAAVRPTRAPALLKRTGNDAVLVTRGRRGMVLFERGGAPVAIPAFGAGEVADVTGAGDTVIAVFTLARASGASFGRGATSRTSPRASSS
jgi:D-beta-D-heptose 7-phosphate kinase/D-beta-D-heptose 1-phosphate adenosyltransferase